MAGRLWVGDTDDWSDHIVGDGGPEDVSLMEYGTGLRAPPEQVRAGFSFQERVRRFLHPHFMDNRKLIHDELFGTMAHASLDRWQLSELNYQESIRGGL